MKYRVICNFLLVWLALLGNQSKPLKWHPLDINVHVDTLGCSFYGQHHCTREQPDGV